MVQKTIGYPAYVITGDPGWIDHSVAKKAIADECASPALLHQIGADFIYAHKDDLPAVKLQGDSTFWRMLSKRSQASAYAGTVEVPTSLAAAAFGRKDLLPRFVRNGRVLWESILTWLVLHGIDEHKLWKLIDPAFPEQLRRRSVGSEPGLSVLDEILLKAEPHLWGAADNYQTLCQALDNWLINHGVHQRKLFWAMRSSDVSRQGLTRGKFDVAALRAAHQTPHLIREKWGLDFIIDTTPPRRRRAPGYGQYVSGTTSIWSGKHTVFTPTPDTAFGGDVTVQFDGPASALFFFIIEMTLEEKSIVSAQVGDDGSIDAIRAERSGNVTMRILVRRATSNIYRLKLQNSASAHSDWLKSVSVHPLD
ncbi:MULTISPECIES: hypothetical protein [unclassified Beijerinckia]|uniref:hypothetical protein n=1 Tax=unclassified Beijerinckia TaxID=2638183 RepID=UPI00089A70A6|nr:MULTISPECIES: hypothetical protein [unclassified Beijerinckia]MDH7795549.1 hypothetical protein [Beijerinckia sp. GAS462]SEC06171.1 hypothetical protein SAMN05443249_1826 [Beijerinckia sp. 28-YEA-48]